MTADVFAQRAREYCLALGGSVTSWGRSTHHNAAVGGDPRSLHLTWRAVDVVYDVTPALSDALAVAAPLGLYVHREGDHDHVRPLEDVWS
jgi:hypothetical protein